MNIVLVNNSTLPVVAYGGPDRIVWWLGKHLVKLGHNVTFLLKKGASCDLPNTRVLIWDEKLPLEPQIPQGTDIVHIHLEKQPVLERFPTIYTLHTNLTAPTQLHPNTVFLSKNHADRHGGSVYVYNGLDPDDYGSPMLSNRRKYLHFLGKADWREKNVAGAIELAERVGERLHVMGGNRVNFRKGLRITLSPNVRFHGMVSGEGKNVIINQSKGLLFPTLWHEPFGLGIIESWWFGCPVFGTPYGALPELLAGHVARNEPVKKSTQGHVEALFSHWGCLSLKKSELVEAIKEADSYDRQSCHDYVQAYYTAERMTAQYLQCYDKVLSGYPLHIQAPTVAQPSDGKLLPWRE
jgi:glycosyltransferase involved in cell wall biosynthesis